MSDDLGHGVYEHELDGDCFSFVGSMVERKSRDGYVFSLNDQVWKISKDKTVNLSWVSRLGHVLGNGVIKTLSFYAENHSADYASNMNKRMERFFLLANKVQITSASVISYYSSLDDDHRHHFGFVRAFLKKWHSLGYEGVDDELIELVVSLKSKGNIKGRAVMSMGLDDGPLTDIEMSSILDLTRAGYLKGALSLEEYTLISVLAYSGRRIVQVCALKVKDVKCIEKKIRTLTLLGFRVQSSEGLAGERSLVIFILWRIYGYCLDRKQKM